MSSPREKKKASLIRAAAKVFAAEGFASTRIADIATHAGVGKGTVYEYFSSKEELFFAVFETTNSHITERIQQRLTAAGPSEQLAGVLQECATVVSELRETYSLNLDFWATCRGGDGECRFKSNIETVYLEYRHLVAGIIRRGQDDGTFRTAVDAESAAAIIVGALDGLGIQHWIDPGVNPHAAIDNLLEILSGGLEQTPS